MQESVSSQKAGVSKISLMAASQQLPVPGEELTISYGEKGNEELLFLYGRLPVYSFNYD